MERCEDILELCYPYLDSELSEPEVERVAAHLGVCPACAARFEAERAMLDLVASAGHEEASASLRERVRGILAGARDEEPAGAIDSRRRWIERLVVPVAAAAVLALVVLQPGRHSAPIADGFASDHVQHALVWPSINPFPAEAPVPDPPELAGSEVEGLSRCVIDGRTYAHYIYDVDGRRVSAYLPLDAMPPPPIGTSIGTVTILSVGERDGLPGAVLASGDLSRGDLARVWSRS